MQILNRELAISMAQIPSAILYLIEHFQHIFSICPWFEERLKSFIIFQIIMYFSVDSNPYLDRRSGLSTITIIIILQSEEPTCNSL